MNNFERLLGDLDLRLFEQINSQSTENDKQSFLAIQSATRGLAPQYKYLEIGSYLGGSIQPHLLDDRCAKIYSVDKRPEQQIDSRGIDYVYQNNSTARMMENLKMVAPQSLEKITTIDGDTREIAVYRVEDKINLCFIDGEHTEAAVISDFKFCLEILEKNGAIMFHDAQVIYNGIGSCIEYLKEKSIEFRAYSLPTTVFVIEIGDFPLHQNPAVLERLTNNHESYIASLQLNDHYRRFANRFPFNYLRNFIIKARKSNVCE